MEKAKDAALRDTATITVVAPPGCGLEPFNCTAAPRTDGGNQKNPAHGLEAMPLDVEQHFYPHTSACSAAKPSAPRK